jgi:hypothetical protein
MSPLRFIQLVSAGWTSECTIADSCGLGDVAALLPASRTQERRERRWRSASCVVERLKGCQMIRRHGCWNGQKIAQKFSVQIIGLGAIGDSAPGHHDRKCPARTHR